MSSQLYTEESSGKERKDAPLPHTQDRDSANIYQTWQQTLTLDSHYSEDVELEVGEDLKSHRGGRWASRPGYSHFLCHGNKPKVRKSFPS